MISNSKFTCVYVDAEFSDLVDMNLISLGLVSDNEDEFYAELSTFPHDACNSFVCETVLPQLGRVPVAMMSPERLRDEGFNHFVTSIVAPVASGWSGCWVGLAPTGKAPPLHGARQERTLRYAHVWTAA